MSTDYKKLTVYTDGGCAINPGGRGGYGVVIIFDTQNIEQFYKGYRITTNNRMEIMAIIGLLERLEQDDYLYDIELYSDSQYMLNCLGGVWKRRKNKDLWDKIDEYLSKKPHKIKCHWVKSHNGNQYNEICDQLATIAQEQNEDKLHEDVDEEFIANLKESKEDIEPQTENTIIKLGDKKYKLIFEELK